MTARALTVEQLVARLADLPGHYPVAVRTIVGGDLVTDDLDLDDVEPAGHASAYAVLVPDPSDHYRTRELIDEALDHRAAADEDLHAAEGVLRDLRRRLAGQ